MTTMKEHLSTEKAVKTAEQIYKKAESRGLHKRLGREKTREASVKIAARQEQEMVENVEEMQFFDRHGLEKGVRKMARHLDEYAPPYGAQVYLKTYEESDEISDEVIEGAEKIIEESVNCQKLVGKSSTAKAAAAIYIASVLTDNYMTHTEVAEVGDVTEPTLRSSYRPMLEEIDLVDEFVILHPSPSRTNWTGETE